MRDRLGWWIAFSIFTAVMAVWALTTPLMGAPDEPAHTVKAVATVRGHLDTAYRRQAVGGLFPTSTPLTRVEVPKPYARLRAQMACWAGRLAVPASCAPRVKDRPGLVTTDTYVGTYVPAYYAIVGLPSLVLGPRPAIYAMRLVSALIVAALLATALMAARRATGRPLVMAGLALVITPTVLFLGGSINPSGVEIAAAIALWCVLLELLSERQRVPDARTALRLGVTAGICVVLRPLSPAIVLAIIGFVALVVAEPAAVRERWGSRPLRVAVGVVVGLALAAVVFLLLVHGQSAFIEFTSLKHRSVGDVVSHLRGDIPDWNEQMVATLGWNGFGAVRLTSLALDAWLLSIAVLIVAALVLGRARVRVGLIVLAAGVVALPLLAELTHRGVPWQGRYSLPLAAGLPLLAGWALDRSPRVAVAMSRTVAAVIVGLTVVIQVYAHQRYMTRVVVGLPNGLFDSLSQGRWTGPLNPWILLLACAVASLALGWALLARLGAEPARSAPPETAPVTSRP